MNFISLSLKWFLFLTLTLQTSCYCLYFLDMVHLADSVAVIFKDTVPLAVTDVQNMGCWCLKYGLLMLFCLKPGPTC